MVDLEAFQDGRVHPLESAHDLLSVSDFPVHPLHLVVVDFASEGDFPDARRSRELDSIPETIRYILSEYFAKA